MNDIHLSLIVIGLVALCRRWEPKIDGARVALVSVFLAIVASVLASPFEFGASCVRGVVTGLSAFGAISANRYATRRLEIAEAAQRFEHAPEASPTRASEAGSTHGHGGHHTGNKKA
ncbi:MAG: hypothetical protein ACHREM_12745 [Polyangiales bacterium]